MKEGYYTFLLTSRVHPILSADDRGDLFNLGETVAIINSRECKDFNASLLDALSESIKGSVQGDESKKELAARKACADIQSFDKVIKKCVTRVSLHRVIDYAIAAGLDITVEIKQNGSTSLP